MILGVLCSGNLGLEVLKDIIKDYNVAYVATDSQSKGIIELAQQNNITLFTGNPRKGRLASFIKHIDYDVLASINYLFLIEEDIINTPKKLAFNIHGSLLPRYRGRTPHVWSIINGEKKAGITAHLIDKGCDTGKIIHQIEVPIENKDTGSTILNKYAEAYFPLVKKVIKDVNQNNFQLKIQDETKATYFGKRTPEDGLIKWDWHWERIYNWVRAQSNPYPGAFAFLDGRKVIIDWVEITDLGYSEDDPNGKIMKVDNGVPFVKCPNGVLKITQIRNHQDFTFEKNQVLNEE